MYLNIILTLIFLIFTGNLWANLTYGTEAAKEREKDRRKQDAINDEVLRLHREMLEELKRM